MTESEALRKFDEFIDETNAEVVVLGAAYNASKALKKTDPIAYREAFNNWCDMEGIEL